METCNANFNSYVDDNNQDNLYFILLGFYNYYGYDAKCFRLTFGPILQFTFKLAIGKI